MKYEVIDILLKIGIPAGAKGFTYIHDALSIMDEDSYYTTGKVCALYAKIATRHSASSSQVERAIRHAFEAALSRGEPEAVARYLGTANTQNSNLLKNLYLRWKQEQRENQLTTTEELDPESEYRSRIYHEVLEEVSTMLVQLVTELKITSFT